jgi:2-polyprenyl-6-methoxyphenol hydroxylase-like FAD-dependent oxidoreductase
MDKGGVETFKTERKNKYVTQVLPRDKLVSVLYHHILNNGINNSNDDEDSSSNKSMYRNVILNYGYKVEPECIDLLDGSEMTRTDTTTIESVLSSVRDKRVLVKVEKIIPDHEDVDKTGGTTIASNNTNTPTPTIVSASLVIAADGSARTFANEMERLDDCTSIPNERGVDGGSKSSFSRTTTTTKQQQRQQQQQRFTVVRYPDDNQRVFKNLSFRLPDGWRRDMNYAVRTSRIIFDALPANDKGDYVGVLLLDVNDDMAQADTNPRVLREFLQQEIPQFVTMITDEMVTTVAKRPPSTLPMFRYVTPRMHYDYKTLLLGDCAHTVKPYFGMGANSALEDVKILSQCIDSNSGDLARAVHEFSNLRSPDIETLVKTSHRLDRPGVEGVLTFLIPIILDGIFSKLLPTVFGPNVISMLQNEEITFQQAVERKRLDRLGQIVFLVGIVGLLVSPLLTLMTSILDSKVI